MVGHAAESEDSAQTNLQSLNRNDSDGTTNETEPQALLLAELFYNESLQLILEFWKFA